LKVVSFGVDGRRRRCIHDDGRSRRGWKAGARSLLCRRRDSWPRAWSARTTEARMEGCGMRGGENGGGVGWRVVREVAGERRWRGQEGVDPWEVVSRARRRKWWRCGAKILGGGGRAATTIRDRSGTEDVRMEAEHLVWTPTLLFLRSSRDVDLLAFLLPTFIRCLMPFSFFFLTSAYVSHKSVRDTTLVARAMHLSQ
jgi:hypothetical protein